MKNLFKKVLVILLFTAVLIPAVTFTLPITAHAAECPEGMVPFKEGCRPNTPANFGLGDLINIPGQWVSGAVGFLAVGVLQITTLFVYLSGLILNAVLQYTVVDMAKNLSGTGSVIDTGWRFIRDLGNMCFIFILLYASIRTIVGAEKGTQTLIVKMVVVGILVNFSLFFTKLVIDLSNALAMTFYDAIAPGALNATASFGLSNSLMEPLRLQTLFKTASFDGYNLLTIGVLGTIFTLIATFVFLAISVMFVVRFVVLIFVLILSPIAFFSFVLPNTQGYSKMWWEALTGQAFFAPIYFILTWIVILFARSMSLAGTNSIADAAIGITEAGVKQANVGAIGTFVNFIILIALMITSLVIAKQFSGKAGVGKITSWATEKAGGLVFGGAASLGRGSFGRLGTMVSESDVLKRRAVEGGLIGRLAARGGMNAGKYVGSSSFDVRNTKVTADLGAGKGGGKGGFMDERKKSSEDENKFAGSLGPSDRTMFFANKAVKDAQNLDHTTPQFNKEYEQARERQVEIVQQKKDDLEKKERDYARYMNQVETDNASSDPNEEKRLKEAVDKARKEAENEMAKKAKMTNKGVEGYKEIQVEEAKKEVDRLKGVDDDRAKEILRASGFEDKEINSKEGKARIAELKKQNKSVGEVRKQKAADNVEKSLWAQIKGYNYTAAAQIRKGKSSKDKIFDAVKEAAKDDAATEETPPAAETAPTPPPPATNPPAQP